MPPLPLIFKTKGYRCAGCTRTDTGANWKWERSFNLTLCHAPKSSSSLCIFLNLFGSSFAYLSALFPLANSRIRNGTMGAAAAAVAAARGGQQLTSGCFRSAAHIVAATIDCISENHTMRCATEEEAQKDDSRGGREG